jgi:hypothetical protein
MMSGNECLTSNLVIKKQRLGYSRPQPATQKTLK